MIKRELGIFLVVGSLTVLVDFLAYRGLVWVGLGINGAKAAGFLLGTVFSYGANRFWTFGDRSHAAGSVQRFTMLYGATLAANVSINSAMLRLLQETKIALPLSFLLATFVSATLNFLGMKLFVFRTDPAPEPL